MPRGVGGSSSKKLSAALNNRAADVLGASTSEGGWTFVSKGFGRDSFAALVSNAGVTTGSAAAFVVSVGGVVTAVGSETSGSAFAPITGEAGGAALSGDVSTSITRS